jgi:predicted lipoprotein with Yx(FWY)xxD motif
VIATVTVAGCGGGSTGGDGGKGETGTTSSGSGGGGAYAAPTAAPNPEEGITFVSLGSVPKLGLVLVDSRGMTLYDFRKDQGTRSACYGACAGAWPPLLTKGPPQASNGSSAGKLGTARRKDGTMQVTYAGHPLYTFSGDGKPGAASGHDVTAFGAQWHALHSSGAEAAA